MAQTFKEVTFSIDTFEAKLTRELGDRSVENVKRVIEEVDGRLISSVRVFVLTNEVQEEVLKHVYVPLNWWEHFKDRWFPLWAKGRWPVVRKNIPVVIKHVRMCPHTRLKSDRTHFSWLNPSEGKYFHG